MVVKTTKLNGVLEIFPNTFFEDFRGEYIETYNKNIFTENGLTLDFNEDDISVSHQNVLRGFHGDAKRTKLITCLYGKFILVVVNNNKSSPEYLCHEIFTLSDKNYKSILIPPNFGNAHLVLSEKAIFHYKQTGTYDRESQFTIKWDDPNINVRWPINNPILSDRDDFSNE